MMNNRHETTKKTLAAGRKEEKTTGTGSVIRLLLLVSLLILVAGCATTLVRDNGQATPPTVVAATKLVSPAPVEEKTPATAEAAGTPGSLVVPIQGEVEPPDISGGNPANTSVEPLVATETGKPSEPREFASLAELKDWLAKDTTDEYVYLVADDSGISSTADAYDCDDYAKLLQVNALKDGFIISIAIVQENDAPHMLNLCAIGNSLYYIEPQTDEVWFYTYLD